MCASPVSFTSLLAARLKERFPELRETQIETRVVSSPKTFTYSSVETLDILSNGRVWRRVAVKRPHGPQGANPEEEFRALQVLEAHFSGRSDLHVPKPLLTLSAPPALVMEAVEGERLHRVLRALRVFQRATGGIRARTLAFVNAAGRWLAHLHNLPPRPHARPVASLEDRMERARGVLVGFGMRDVDSPMTTRREFAKIGGISTRKSIKNGFFGPKKADTALEQRDMTTRKRTAPPASARPSGQIVTLHGDYTLRNIICHEQGVTAFDTELAFIGSPAYDIGHFFAALRFIDREQLLTRGRLYPETALNEMEQAFLEGYESERERPDPKQIARHTAARLLERWAEFAVHLNAAHPALARGLLPCIVHPYFRSAIERTSIEGDY